MPSEASIRSSHGNFQQLKILTAAMKLMEANRPSNEELLVQSESFLAFWIENKFKWITAAFFMANSFEDLNVGGLGW